MKIREYVLVQDKYMCSKLEMNSVYDWEGDLVYTDEIHRMLNEVFRMNRLLTERAYVLSFDHKKQLKGICQIGQGDISETPLPYNNVFTFLLLTGAAAFVVVHNHVSNLPEASQDDEIKTFQGKMLSNIFGIEFIGHMIINPNGYTIDGGTMDGTTKEESEIEYLENGMAATYIFGNRIEGTVEDIKKILGYESYEEEEEF